SSAWVSNQRQVAIRWVACIDSTPGNENTISREWAAYWLVDWRRPRSTRAENFFSGPAREPSCTWGASSFDRGVMSKAMLASGRQLPGGARPVLRFVVGADFDRVSRLEGPFGSSYRLADEDDCLPPWHRDELRDSLAWFEEHLRVPPF